MPRCSAKPTSAIHPLGATPILFSSGTLRARKSELRGSFAFHCTERSCSADDRMTALERRGGFFDVSDRPLGVETGVEGGLLLPALLGGGAVEV